MDLHTAAFARGLHAGLCWGLTLAGGLVMFAAIPARWLILSGAMLGFAGLGAEVLGRVKERWNWTHHR